MNGGILGPLFTCLIADQFVRLKQGDSFWYERKIGPQKFSKPQLNQIYGTLLSSIICRNSDKVTFTQRYVMKRSGSSNLLEDCESLDTFDFTPWKETKESQRTRYFRVETDVDQLKVMVVSGNTTTTAEAPINTSTEKLITSTDTATTTNNSTSISNNNNETTTMSNQTKTI